MDFFESGGISCRLLNRTSGLQNAVFLLLQLCREILPVERINFVGGSKDLKLFVPIVDTNPYGVQSVREMGNNRRWFSIVASECDLSQPLVINDLDPFKREAVARDPSAKDLPFYAHASLLRFPLFLQNNFIFLANFWSLQKNAFDESQVEGLRKLTRPLAEDLVESFVDMGVPQAATPPVPLTGLERIGQCAGLAPVRRSVEKVAPTGTTVLIIGETGCGKEVVAEALHELSPRRTGPLVRVNCGAIPHSLMESELFGYEKGAFTGAQSRRVGYFEYAHGGTLFLDEIGELSLPAQVQLLRVLDRKEIQRVGDPQTRRVDVRVVAATNKDLEAMAAKGEFRSDLFYRLAVYPIIVPPLRERKVDILPLVRYFIKEKSYEFGVKIPPVPPRKELDKLYAHHWPGNVRELQHVIERALIDSMGESTLRILSFRIKNKAARPAVPTLHGEPDIAGSLGRDAQSDNWPTLAQLEDKYIRMVLEKTGGKLTGKDGAATLLGIHYTTLKAKMREVS